ncbi:MAG: hypothetical protein LBH84_01900 [Prevotellaceae bacterium]|jgi:hypothetical protein|nr:hypothetical protein [Prevotellaceae bacterium]
MKKIYLMAAAASIAASVVTTGCGGSKASLQSTTGQQAVEQDICEKMQEEKPVLRAVGIGQHFKESTARNIAEAQARAQFARALATAVTTATSEEAFDFSLYSGDSGTGNSVNDQGSKSNDLVESVAKEVVAGTVPIKISKYILPNKQYKVYVCLEYQKGVSALAAEVSRKVEQKIPDEQKLKMNFEFEQYRKRVQAELEKNK